MEKIPYILQLQLFFNFHVDVLNACFLHFSFIYNKLFLKRFNQWSKFLKPIISGIKIGLLLVD